MPAYQLVARLADLSLVQFLVLHSIPSEFLYASISLHAAIETIGALPFLMLGFLSLVGQHESVVSCSRCPLSGVPTGGRGTF